MYRSKQKNKKKYPKQRKLYLGNSAIHNDGIFLNRAAKKGEIVGIIKGPIVSKVNKSKRESNSLKDASRIGIKKDHWIEPVFPFNKINHSCNPNVGIKGTVTVVALKNINAHKEITLDYSTTEIDPLWGIKCQCKDKNCRGDIGDIHSLKPRHFLKLYPYINRYFKKVYLRYNEIDAK